MRPGRLGEAEEVADRVLVLPVAQSRVGAAEGRDRVLRVTGAVGAGVDGAARVRWIAGIGSARGLADGALAGAEQQRERCWQRGPRGDGRAHVPSRSLVSPHGCARSVHSLGRSLPAGREQGSRRAMGGRCNANTTVQEVVNWIHCQDRADFGRGPGPPTVTARRAGSARRNLAGYAASTPPPNRHSRRAASSSSPCPGARESALGGIFHMIIGFGRILAPRW